MHPLVSQVIKKVEQIIVGKHEQVKLSLTCLLAGGHLLIEDLPGMGKTTLSHVLAKVLGLSYTRIQFTSDLLPADILGSSVFDRDSGQFVFHRGPIFAQVVLADEINRATPKTQSALLEAMEEQQVSLDGELFSLPNPFFVIATQNPVTQSGTFPLPESQLDRFLMRITLGYPDPEAERTLLKGDGRRNMANDLQAQISIQDLQAIQRQVLAVKASDALLDYVQRLLAYSRSAEDFTYGLSPRAGLALLRAAKSWALVSGRDYVVPEDVQWVLPSVVAHRISEHGYQRGEALAQKLLTAVDVVQ